MRFWYVSVIVDWKLNAVCSLRVPATSDV